MFLLFIKKIRFIKPFMQNLMSKTISYVKIESAKNDFLRFVPVRKEVADKGITENELDNFMNSLRRKDEAN